VALHFYNTKIQIDLMKEEVVFDTVHVTFQLEFDNQGFMAEDPTLTLFRDEKLMPIQAHVFLDIFPFCLVFA
jgi:guanylate cyclase